MNDRDKKDYLERYKQAKEKGVPFFPDIVFKDAIAALVIFLILAALAYFVGVPMEARADPNDANYTPRPEWYFLFLFQLLKYFPGQLEFIGAMLLPGLFILLLLALPFIDRNPKRHFLNRPFASVAAVLVVVGILALTVLSVREAPPPQISSATDRAAQLYAQNCANCHGPAMAVSPATDLHQLIAEGKHEGMPAWGGDLSTDEIDALAGFITSPSGSALYARECAECHRDFVVASGNPQELDRVFSEGAAYPPHKNLDLPNWKVSLSDAELNALLNFLAAPDGQRLFDVNCSGCHGTGVTFTGDEAALRELISVGGQHLDMPAWQGTLSEDDIDTLAAYVTDPTGRPAGETLFGQHCAACHGARVPSSPDMVTARKVIRGGGAHVTMPVWGDVLTPEQLDALVQFTLTSAQGGGTQEGARLFADNCAVCHGQFGQGGPNPMQAGDLLSPISTKEYLETRDDTTLRNVISQGQPDLGMSPFGSAFGGPLDDEQIDQLISYIRSWETNPPPAAPTAIPAETGAVAPAAPAESKFSEHVLPVLAANCQMCHNSATKLGGWDASSYESVTTTGNNAPVVIPGDAENSLVARLIQGAGGPLMPPGGKLPEGQIQLILDWIAAGAEND